MTETIGDGKYESTRKTTNRARLERIIFGPCRDVLCALLSKEIDPSDLLLCFNNFIGNGKASPFNSEQKSLIQSGNYTDFDITVLYTLLRNICSFTPHRNQWGREPNPGDRSVSANIERIRLARNQHGHDSEISLSDVDFNTKWQHIYDTVRELEQYLGTSCDYQDAIIKLKTCSMDPEQEVKFTKQLWVFQREISERIDKCVPMNVQAIYDKDTSKWRDDDKLFVEIHNFPAILEQVRNHSFVTFVGVPGSGKTATARHIALILKREGYQILPIKSLKYLEKYCDPENPQVFVIDDVLGIFGIDRDALKKLCMFKDRLKKPLMPDTKIIMTCREVVFRNEALAGCFLGRKKNVILLNSGENVLNDQDEQNLLAAYQLNKDLLVSIKLKSSLYRKMFPLLFKLFSEKKFRVYGPEFFSSPIPCILKMLDNIKSENKIQYGSLVLLMANENKLSKDTLEHESSRHFNDMKCKLFSACRVNRNTEIFEVIDALSEMIGTYTRKCDNEFSFLHASMLEITAYHFGQQFPELLLQYMPGNYIANYIKVDPHDTEKRGKYEGEDKSHKEEEEKINLCITLQKSLHQMLAERLSRDVMNREFYDVFGNEALKHPTVLQAFIGVMKEMPYQKLFSVFLLELKEKFKRYEQAKFGVKGEDYFDIQKLLLGEKTTKRHYKDSVRAISWVIYHGHHQILQYIIDRILEENKKVDDLFRNFEDKDNRPKTNRELVGAGKLVQKDADYYTIGPSYLKNYATIIRTCNKKATEEQFRLLCLSCYSGNLNTVRIILSHVKTDVVINPSAHVSGEKQNVIWNFKPLVIACKLGYVEIAKELLKSKADVNLNDATHTPLTAACENGHLDVVKVLIKAGADVNLCNRSQTPLTAACGNGDMVLVRLLIIEGANVNLCNGNQTPLTVACRMGHISIVKMLINAERDLDHGDKFEPPFLAAGCLKDLSKKKEITKEGENLNVEYENINSDSFREVLYQMRLQNDKVNVNKRDKNKTPLTAACCKGFSEIVQLLVVAGADIDLEDASHTPLTAACENGHLRVVDILIKEGADVNLCDGNQTPLTAACYRGNFRIVQMLIQMKVQVDKGNACGALKTGTCSRQDVNEVEEFSKTEANLNLEYEGETKLVKATVDINKRDKKKTPLTAACYNGHANIVQLLIESGADINLHDVSYVPLTAACKYGHLSVVKLLINANANVNKNYRWNTPLRTACFEGRLSIVKELIRANANINQIDVGKTPLGIACLNGHLNIVKELIREGANINLKEAESPMMLARKNGHLSVVEELNKADNLRD